MMPSMVQEVLVAWKEGWFGGGIIGTIWCVVPLCLMWCIWCEQNAQGFEGEELIVFKLKYLFLKTLYEWTSLTSSFSADGFLSGFPEFSFVADFSFLCFCSFVFELPLVYSLYSWAFSNSPFSWFSMKLVTCQIYIMYIIKFTLRTNTNLFYS